MTIWTGAVSSNFTEAGNWDSSSVPGSGDLAVIASGSNAPVLNGSAVISALEYASSSAELQVFGQLTAITAEVSGILSLKAGSTSTISTLVVATGGTLDNHGSLTAGNSSEISSALGLGNFNNFGELTLNGAVHANLSNHGKITVNAPARIDEFATLSNTAELVVNSTLTLGGGRAGLAGNLEINLNNSSLNPSGIFAQGVLSVGLNTLVVDTTAVGSLTAGNERTLLHTSVTAMDAFSVANYAVIGQHATFAYALRLVGLDTFVSSLTLRALNDGATGGRAVLDEALSSRAITLDINSDSGRGTIHGGSFADAHASLLHGVDEVRGGSGHDVLRVTGGTTGFTLAGNQGNDQISGGLGTDALSGGAGNDSISGGAGADTLDGGTGTDSLTGGTGDDRFLVDSTADLVVELAGGGNDSVETSASWTASAEVETVTALGSSALNLTGNAVANKLTGNAAANRLTGLIGNDTLYGAGGDDTLDGGTGSDLMLGGTGNDQFILDSASDRVMELSTGGTDTVLTSATWIASAEVEVITATLTAAIDITGNAKDNTITGNGAANRLNGSDGNDSLLGGAGNDTLEGGTGTDRLTGGAGNDQFILDSGTDQVVEVAGGGTDTALTAFSWAAASGIERLVATGTVGISLTGNGLANKITGNSGANRLSGLGGADTILGGAGKDSITGGGGADSLTGGAGRDEFIFANSFGADRITDFDATGAGDKLNLAAVTAITSYADLRAHHLTFSGGNAVITVGSNKLVLAGVSNASLDATDFIF